MTIRDDTRRRADGPDSPKPAAGRGAGAWRLPVLRLPARLSGLDRIAGYVEAVVARSGLGPAAGYRLRLAVEELAANVVMHGYAGRPGELAFTGGGDGACSAWIEIEDGAPPFDPASGHRSPASHLPVSDRPIGGLGIHLALAAADEFRYEYAAGRNRSTVTVRPHPDEGGSRHA
jgi:anti-sigma regulatory factor (Ser/Thr protein kinase)